MHVVVSLPLVLKCVHDPQADEQVWWVCESGCWGTSLAVQVCGVDICDPAEVDTWCLGERGSVCCTVDQCLAEKARSRGSPAAALECQQRGSNPLLRYLLSGSESSALLGEAVPLPPRCSVNRVYNSNTCHWKPNCCFDTLQFMLYTWVEFVFLT